MEEVDRRSAWEGVAEEEEEVTFCCHSGYSHHNHNLD